LEAQKQRHRAKFPEPGANSPLCFRTQGAQRRDLGLRTPARAETQKLGSGARCPVGGDPSAQRGAGFPEQGYGARAVLWDLPTRFAKCCQCPKLDRWGRGILAWNPSPGKTQHHLTQHRAPKINPSPRQMPGAFWGQRNCVPSWRGARAPGIPSQGACDPSLGVTPPSIPMLSFLFFVFFLPIWVSSWA
jgi:hypothetical protein